MIPNNNLSVFPFYTSLADQNARKWWIYDRIYPLFTQAGFLLPFQILMEYRSNPSMSSCVLYNARTNVVVDSSVATKLNDTGFGFKQFSTLGYTVAVYPGALPAFTTLANGQYYLRITINGTHYYSEVFTVVNDIAPYLKIEWWDDEDFTMDSGVIVYKSPAFENILYLDSDIAKPDYIFEEEGETRDGYFYPFKQISEKRYRFKFLACEYLLDVMRFIRMADHIRITYHGQVYDCDTFLMTPEWEEQGDIASVEVEFDTATVAKSIGRGYVRAMRGDFNDDFNNDFNNQNE